MGKITVPMIGGLEELLAIVRDDNKITKYLKQMQDLRDSIAKNLVAYEHHSDLDTRERAVQSIYTAAEAFRDDANIAAEKSIKSINVRRKNLKQLEEHVQKAEKDLKERQKGFDAACKTFAENSSEFKEHHAISVKDMEAKEKSLDGLLVALDAREAELNTKLTKLKEMFG